jgi:hypothetical protein
LIEASTGGARAEARRSARQQRAKLIVDSLQALARRTAREIAETIRYALTRWTTLALLTPSIGSGTQRRARSARQPVDANDFRQTQAHHLIDGSRRRGTTLIPAFKFNACAARQCDHRRRVAWPAMRRG